MRAHGIFHTNVPPYPRSPVERSNLEYYILSAADKLLDVVRHVSLKHTKGANINYAAVLLLIGLTSTRCLANYVTSYHIK